MKKPNLTLVSLVLNVVLLVAVGILYVLFFFSDSFGKSESELNIDPNLASTSSILYIDIDSVLNNYDFYYDVQRELERSQKTLEAQLAQKEKKYRDDATDYQYKVERGLVTRTEAQQLQQNLMNQQLAYEELQRNLSMQLAEKAQVAQSQVLNAIMEYLGKTESINSYQYVLGATFGGNVLYANDSLNITKEVVRGLNAEYKEKLEAEE